jgi:hypothetical protein
MHTCCNGNCRQGRDCPNRKPISWKVLLALLLLPFTSKAGDTLEYTAQGLFLTDWLQTRYIVQHPWIERNGQVRLLEEANPILGHHPSMGKVDIYFPAVMAAHWEADHLMADRWRPWFEGGTIAAELITVVRNRALGIALFF